MITLETIVPVIAEAEEQTPPAPLQEPKVEATTPTPKEETAKEQVGQVEQVFELKGFTKREDGKFEFKIDPDDPESTVYVGDNPDDIIIEIQKGIKEKDSVIRKSKIKDSLKVEQKLPTLKVTEPEENKLPDEREISRRLFLAAIKETGVDLEKYNWTDEQWDAYADEKNLRPWRVVEERQVIARIVDETNQKIDKELIEQRVIYNNSQTLNGLVTLVSDLLEDAKIPETMIGKGKPFDFDEILNTGFKNHTDKNGELDGKGVLADAQKSINRIGRQTGKTALQRKLDEDAERAKKAIEKIKSPGGVGAEQTKTIKVATDYSQASRDFFRTHKIGE